MSLIRLGLIGALAGTALCAPAQAETRIVEFEPASDWILDYAEDSCALRRAFADRRGRVVYADMRQQSPNSYLTFTVYSEDVERTPEEVRYRFEPDDDTTDVNFAFMVDFGENARGIRFSGNLLRDAERPEDPEDYYDIPLSQLRAREAAITSFVILEGFAISMSLNTGPLTAPMDAMRTCLDELLTHWGIEPAVQQTLTRRAEPRNWTSVYQNMMADFPAAMIRERQSATMQIRAIVGANGRVEECSFFGLIGEAEYGETACDTLVRYIRFNPALDESGEPVVSYWTTDFSFFVE